MPAPRTAFVTGGTGFIGSHLVELLLETGYTEVRCLIRSEPRWLRGTDIVRVHGTLADRSALRTGCRNADVIYHLAGVTRAQEWETFRKVNVEATRHLLDVVAAGRTKPQRIVIASSLAVIGTGTDGIAAESTPLEPVSRYGRSKAQMEQIAAEYRTDLPITIIRPPAVYGPRDEDIFAFFRAVDYGLCPVVGDPERPQLSLVHARDLVDGIVQSAHSPAAEGETYFVGSERPYSWSEIKDAACRALDHSAVTLRIPRPAVAWCGAAAEQFGRLTRTYPPFNRQKARELLHACKMCAVKKAKTDFEYRQRVSLEDGIADTIRWYKKEGWL